MYVTSLLLLLLLALSPVGWIVTDPLALSVTTVPLVDLQHIGNTGTPCCLSSLLQTALLTHLSVWHKQLV